MNRLIVAFSHETTAGTFWIRLGTSGRWHAFFEEERLGSYLKPEQAAEELAIGTTSWPSVGNPEDFGIPDDLSEWHPYWRR